MKMDGRIDTLIAIDNSNIGILKAILSKCTKIKSFDFQIKSIAGDGNLMAIVNLCPKLEAICFEDFIPSVSQ